MIDKELYWLLVLTVICLGFSKMLEVYPRTIYWVYGIMGLMAITVIKWLIKVKKAQREEEADDE